MRQCSEQPFALWWVRAGVRQRADLCKRLVCVYAGQLLDRLLSKQQLRARQHQCSLWQQWAGLCGLPGGHRVQERLMCVYAGQLPQRLLRRQHLPARQHQPGLWDRRGDVRQLRGGPGVSERLLRLHARELPERLLRERRL